MEVGWGCCSQPHAKVPPSPRPREEESEAQWMTVPVGLEDCQGWGTGQSELER